MLVMFVDEISKKVPTEIEPRLNQVFIGVRVLLLECSKRYPMSPDITPEELLVRVRVGRVWIFPAGSWNWFKLFTRLESPWLSCY